PPPRTVRVESLSYTSRGSKRISPLSCVPRNSGYAARSSADGARNFFSRADSSARFVSICFNTSSRDSDCAKALIDRAERMATNTVAVKALLIVFYSFSVNTSKRVRERTAGRDFCAKRFGQTPDLPATHAAFATVAPFPAWRGSQDEHCAEPGI